MSARYSQENNPKRTSKTALLNDKFSRAVFCLSYLFFRQGIMGDKELSWDKPIAFFRKHFAKKAENTEASEK